MDERHQVFADGAWAYVADNDSGCGQSQSARLSALEHADGGFLRRGARGSSDEVRVPEISNIDQGAQFTSQEWIEVLNAADVAISTDGKGRWMDNVFIERLWRSVKYEGVYLHAYTPGSEARACLTRYFAFYNARRLHDNLSNATPDEVYFGALAQIARAAA